MTERFVPLDLHPAKYVLNKALSLKKAPQVKCKS